MGDIFRRIFAFMSFRDGARVRAAVGMVMLAAQLVLVSHQFQHHLDFDRGDDCAQCQFAAGMDAAPAPSTLALPIEAVIFRQPVLPAEQTLHRFRPAANFNSRAPPLSVLV